MADKATIRTLGIQNLSKKLRAGLTFQDIVAAFQAATVEQRQAFASAAYTGPASDLRQKLDDVIRPYSIAQATTVVDNALADDSLTLDELEQILL